MCDPSKLNFNGGYNCTGTTTSFTCSLVCPDGVPFSFQPETSYTCLYSEGVFKPKHIPECVTGNGIIIKGQEHSYRTYSKMDLTSIDWYLILNGISNLYTLNFHLWNLDFRNKFNKPTMGKGNRKQMGHGEGSCYYGTVQKKQNSKP